ncbi:CTP synthase [Candidatus Fermentibacteria bacterium]|nr:CTP synthase [Candidatus Fermentibacteria bacterium]
MDGEFRIVSVLGGVLSGIGKGLATASIARILQEYGYRTTAMKIDPYINYDAGTLRPTEHGEVWVTFDGGEIDQDLGTYERFLGRELSKRNNITTGQVYKSVIERERRGEYLGKTVQLIPHIQEEIVNRILEIAHGYECVLVEVGGTIGDHENVPFLLALKHLERRFGPGRVVHVLLTYLPIPGHLGEMKTKPAQQAIRMLSETGIFPTLILCRAEHEVDQVRKNKIETYANIDADSVISAPDVRHLYSLPLLFEREGLGRKLLAKLGLPPRREPDWRPWRDAVYRLEHPQRSCRIAIVGKYVDSGSFSLSDSYVSINRALEHAAVARGTQVEVQWVDSKTLEHQPPEQILAPYHGIIIPGGFGATGMEGKIAAICHAREQGLPFLGLCYGLHLAVVEYARNVMGLVGAATTEVEPMSPHPVIDLLPSQKERMKTDGYGGTMRLGAYSAQLDDTTEVYRLYRSTGRLDRDRERLLELRDDPAAAFRVGGVDLGRPCIIERHRHRYEVNDLYVDQLRQAGLLLSGWHVRVDGRILVEFIELQEHEFFVATQAHPEFRSRLEDPSPLFLGLVEAAERRAGQG